MSECTGCSWFREVTPSKSRIGILRSLLHSTHAEVEQELNRIEAEEFGKCQAEDQEVKLKTARAQYLLSQIGGDFHTCEVPQEIGDQHLERTVAGFPVRFEGQPQCVTHCAQKATSHVWFIPSLRNWAGYCTTSQPARAESDCRRCSYYVSPTGDEDDARELVTITNTLGETDSEAAPILLARKSVIEQKIGPHKASDLALAYNGDGRIPGRLKYLPFCSKHSVVPQLWNRFSDCQSFVEAGRAAASQAQGPPTLLPQAVFSGAEQEDAREPARAITSRQTALPEMPLQSGESGRQTTLGSMGASPFASMAAAGTCRSTTDLSSAAQNLVGMFFGQLRNCLSGAAAQLAGQPSSTVPVQILAPGDPPLTEEMLRRSADVAAAAFGKPFSPEEHQRYREFTITAWNRNIRRAIDAQLNLIGDYDALRVGTVDRSQAARQLKAFLTACGVGAGPQP